MRALARIVFLACAFALSAQLALAQPVAREVLALYDSRIEAEPADTIVHMRLEAVLNYLGFIARYADVNAALPTPSEVTQFAGVVTWFTSDLAEPGRFLEWAAATAAQGVPFIVVGYTGVPTSAEHRAQLNAMLAGAGVAYEDGYVETTAGTTIEARDPAMIGFERDLDRVLPSFPILTPAGPETRAALVVRGPAVEGSPQSVLVATGPAGGHIAPGFEIHYDAFLDRMAWIVDPFVFLERALGAERFPVPDTTTVSGRRLYFSHVDGDGWLNLSELEEDRAAPRSAAQVMLDELIAPYPDLPVTVGLVGCDIDPEIGGGAEAAEIARAIFALPQVEVASHTFSHPFVWPFFEHYERAEELALLEAARARTEERSLRGFFASLSTALGLGRAEHSHGAGLWTAGSASLPRACLRDPFDLDVEIDGSLALATALAPEGKRAEIYLWSGFPRPFEAAVAATRAAGVRNMNGGNGRLDAQFPSVGYIVPIGREVGGQRQIYAVASNENSYTDLWTAHFHGFGQLAETIARTELPRRLAGVNVYYHTYSAEKRVSLEAVRRHLDWARTAPLAPIEASRYAAIADGFFSTRIERLAPGRWRILDRDGLDTVRFDDAEALAIDLEASLGVLGTNRHAGSLYVALDPALPAAEVAVVAREEARPYAWPDSVELSESSWLARDMVRAADGVALTVRGFGDGFFRFAGLPEGVYRIEASRDGAAVFRASLAADEAGGLAFTMPLDGLAPVRLALVPEGPEP